MATGPRPSHPPYPVHAPRRPSRPRGFTLLELLVVMVLAGIVVS
ncbi:prepilin-type N-terminal cleavage/methylation domain-containing protein, partial [Acinetobacter baumannii]